MKEEHTADLRGEICPFTMVLAKRAIEEIPLGEVLTVVLDHRPALIDVPQSLRAEGHTILEVRDEGPGPWEVLVRRER